MLNGKSIAVVVTAAFMASAVFSAGAQAAPVVHNLAVSFDGSAPLADIGDVVTPNGTSLRLRSFGSVPIGPLSIGEGVTVNMTITFTGGGLSISDDTFGEQLFMMNFSNSSFSSLTDNPAFDPLVTYDRSRDGAVTSFSGDYDGLLDTTPVIGTSSGTPTFRFSASGLFTDTTMTISEMTVTSTYTNIAYQPGFEIWEGALIDGFNLTVFDEIGTVPAPGALALLCLGLLGLSVRGRTA